MKHKPIPTEVRNDIKKFASIVFLAEVVHRAIAPKELIAVLQRSPSFQAMLHRNKYLLDVPTGTSGKQTDKRPRWHSLIRELLKPTNPENVKRYQRHHVTHNGTAWVMKSDFVPADLSKFETKQKPVAESKPVAYSVRMFKDCLVVTVPAGMKVLVETTK